MLRPNPPPPPTPTARYPRFSAPHSRGKGTLVQERCGTACAAPVPLLTVVSAYRAREAQRLANQRPQATPGSCSGIPSPSRGGGATGSLQRRGSAAVYGSTSGSFLPMGTSNMPHAPQVLAMIERANPVALSPLGAGGGRELAKSRSVSKLRWPSMLGAAAPALVERDDAQAQGQWRGQGVGGAHKEGDASRLQGMQKGGAGEGLEGGAPREEGFLPFPRDGLQRAATTGSEPRTPRHVG